MTSYLSAALSRAVPPALHDSVKRLLVGALSSVGPLPQHVAFIMDGNRRYARESGLDILRGHADGFKALGGLLDFFLQLGVPVVSIYAFSIDNFARPADEVDALMQLAREKLLELAGEGKLLRRYNVRVRIVGNLALLPVEVQAACRDVEALTARHTWGTLNVCMPYTSREEMTSAIQRSIASAHPSRIDASALAEELYTAKDEPAPDLLIRTSGVNRLSDFLLWQTVGNDARCKGASIHFLPRYWPEVGVADLLPILLSWQARQTLEKLRLAMAC